MDDYATDLDAIEARAATYKMRADDAGRLSADVLSLVARCRELEAKNAKLCKALNYYVRECPHHHGGTCDCLVARAALEKKP